MNTKSIFLSCLCLFAACLAQAQVPQLISYQAVARDVTGKILSEKVISVQVEILQGSHSGPVAYSESHALTTTKTGTINLLIGGGDVIKDGFADIDWGSGPYFMKLSMKQDKESEYKEVSNTQMLSVPYALYAEKAGEVVNGGSGSSPAHVRDYAITGMDNFSTIKMLSDGFYEIDADFHESHEVIRFELMILYLTGSDLQMDMAIEGAEISTDGIYTDVFPSSKMGRVFSFNADVYVGTTIKLLIKDKDGHVVDEFPIKIIEKTNKM